MLAVLVCDVGRSWSLLEVDYKDVSRLLNQTWCVANPSLSFDTLENVKSYACNEVDCSSINSGDPCFVPSNLVTRASFSMNAYFQERHDCVGGFGLKAVTNPSYENCKFDGSEEAIPASAALGKWCIAKPSAPYSLLELNIEFACSQVDCSIFQTDSECQSVDTIMYHASVAMNLFYQASNRTDLSCYFKSTGMIVTEDPSFGTCTYKRKGEEGGAGVPVSLVKKHRKSSVFQKAVAITLGTIMSSGLALSVTVVCYRNRINWKSSEGIQSEMHEMSKAPPCQSQSGALFSMKFSLTRWPGCCI